MDLNGRLIATEGCLVSDGSKLVSVGQSRAWHESDGDGEAEAAYGTGGEDRVVDSLDAPDRSGFIKAGLFGASPPRMSARVFEANLCEWVCECVESRPPSLPPLDEGGTHQGCVNQKIREQHYDSATGHRYPMDDSPVWSEVSFHKNDDWASSPPSHRRYDVVESRAYPGKPTSAAIRNDTWRLDVVKVGPDGRLEMFYDMKFGKDDPNFRKDPDRKRAYEAIAKKYTGSEGNFVPFVVEKECGCMKRDEAQPQAQPQPQREPKKSLLDKFKEMLRPSERPIDFPPDPDAPKPPTAPPVMPLPLPGMPLKLF
jgi:hypothetical protein